MGVSTFVVGYTADRRGAEAVALAASIAAGAPAELILAIVLPEHTPFDAHYPGTDHGYGTILGETVDRWAAEALALVPEGVPCRVVARSAASEAEGLMQIAAEAGAETIVVGAQRRGITGRFTPGSVAGALLHSSPVPVALAPVGEADPERSLEGPSRITAFVGTRPGAAAVVRTAAAAAVRRNVPLRVVSLVELDLRADDDDARAALARETEETVASAVASLGVRADVVVASADTVEEAVEALDWEPREIAVVGSSRLARKRRLFLGSTGQRMLRALPVPLVVVPRGYKPPVR
ncbi:universal stress protein [Arthrobacter sp.]|uniref:universal stress protein n=1 Tax=Arthrobacter sp. TaxID=1667 RepID=UPI00366CA773